MDSQFMQELRDLWVQHGGDLDRWPTNAKDRIAVAWYEYDERDAARRPNHCPDWMADALSDLVTCNTNRGKLLAALKEGNHPGKLTDALEAISLTVTAKLLLFPLDTIAEQLRLYEPDFIGWRNENDRRLHADSVNEAKALCG